jgi:hypothetical protein
MLSRAQRRALLRHLAGGQRRDDGLGRQCPEDVRRRHSRLSGLMTGLAGALEDGRAVSLGPWRLRGWRGWTLREGG